jgi:hypothetical protein
MSGVSLTRSGRQNELQARGIGDNSIVTPDNGGILLEQETLKAIANQISKTTMKKLTQTDVNALIRFIRDMPPDQFYNKSIKSAISQIARTFLNRVKIQQASAPKDTGSIQELAGLDGPGTINDYMQKELNQTTDDENQYKWTAHSDRRGNAIIDRQSVEHQRSTPNAIAPVGSPIDQIAETMQYIKQFLHPANIDELFKRSRSTLTSGLQTYENITFPHREVPFDSRNRDLTDTTPNGIKWYLHSAGRPGHLGDIHIQDTLQQVIRMKISSFWLPVADSTDIFYKDVQMYIHEFFQRSDVTEFLDSDQSAPTTYGYHFRFKISKHDVGRIYLEPEEEYTFSKPVAQIDTITVSFRNPFSPIVLAADRGTYTATYGNPTLFTLTSAGNHNLSTGDLIYSLNFTTTNTTLRAELNNQRGHLITRINNTQFTIPVDTTAISPGTQTGVSVYYGSKRVFFQIEFTSLEH